MLRNTLSYTGLLLTILLLSLLPKEKAVARNSQGRFVVVLDAGHGGHDAGAVGKKSKEKDIVLKVAQQVGQHLGNLAPNIVVLYTRQKDVYIGLNERADYANRKKADLFVSIHANSLASRSPKVKGTETYVLGLASSQENLAVAMKENSVILKEDNYTTKYEGFDPNSTESYIIFEFMQNKYLESSLDVASGIHQGLTKNGLHNRGVKQAGFLVLRRTSMPSVLIELGFITNPNDEAYMTSSKGQQEMSESIARAIISYAKKVGINGPEEIATVAPSTEVTQPTAQKDKESEEPLSIAPPANNTVPITYRVQIHTDTRKLSASHQLFKGYHQHLKWYKEGKEYKYTLYDVSTEAEAKRLRRTLAKRYKGCFVVRMQGEQRLH